MTVSRFLSASLLLAAPLFAQSPEVDRLLASLTLEERAAQLVMVPFYGGLPNAKSPAYRELHALVTDVRVGGFILLNRVQRGNVIRADPHAVATFLNRMQRLSKLPLIAGGDFERGASMRVEATAPFPHAMAFGATGDPALTRALGAATAREARAMGIHWIFAPVADVNNNPDNPVIHLRAFGEDPGLVANHVRAFIEGARGSAETPALVTVKHFPGHGDTAEDSHYGLARVTAPAERLRSLELAPFRAAIAAGVDSVMTAHVIVPALEPAEIPATVSPAILTGLLRNELGFTGLVSTDALDMRGLSRFFDSGEAAVRALEAGADLVLMPPDPRAAVKAVAAAVRSGRLSAARLDDSVRKLLAAKVRLNLHQRRMVDLDALPDALDTPEDQALAAETARRAITVIRNPAGLLPLKNPARACLFVLPPTRTSTLGEAFAAAIAEASPKMRVETLSPQLTPAAIAAAVKTAASCETVVAAYAAYNAAYPQRAALAGNYPALIEKLQSAGRPLALVALGNPYPLRHFPALPALVSFSTVPLSEEAAARALLGLAPISGVMPVSLPPPPAR